MWPQVQRGGENHPIPLPTPPETLRETRRGRFSIRLLWMFWTRKGCHTWAAGVWTSSEDGLPRGGSISNRISLIRKETVFGQFSFIGPFLPVKRPLKIPAFCILRSERVWRHERHSIQPHYSLFTSTWSPTQSEQWANRHAREMLHGKWQWYCGRERRCWKWIPLSHTWWTEVICDARGADRGAVRPLAHCNVRDILFRLQPDD